MTRTEISRSLEKTKDQVRQLQNEAANFRLMAKVIDMIVSEYQIDADALESMLRDEEPKS